MKEETISHLKKLTQDRFFIIYVLFAVMGVIIVSKLVDLQIIHGEDNVKLATRKMLSISQESAPRGGIYDRNGVPIATVRTSFFVKISKSNSKYAERQAAYLKLVNILEANGENYRKKLSGYLKFEPLDFSPEIKNSPEKLAAWKKDMLGKEDIEGLLATPESTFTWLRNKKFSIEPFYSDSEAYRIMTVLYDLLINGYVYINPFAADISRTTVGELEENRMELPGISVEVEPVRKYFDADSAAHIIGFLGPIDQSEYKKLKDRGYNWNDWIGKDGIEYYAEKWLKGTDGLRSIETDFFGDPEETYGIKNSVPGCDITLTIDMNIQKAADKALKDQIAAIREMTFDTANMRDAYAGAVVAIEIKTGDVLAMASFPDYDPDLYLNRNNTAAMNTINKWMLDSFNSPLLNRAISGMFAPGSTFKLVTVIAAMDTGMLNPNSYFSDFGSITVDGQEFKNVGGMSYGQINLETAIVHSVNTYFHTAGMKTGIEAIDKYAAFLGLGEKTGIELPGEIAGVRANPQTKKQIWNDIWRPADTAQTAIGQFSQAYTPLQMASYASALGNNGVRYLPRLIKDVVNSDMRRPDDFNYEKNFVDAGVSDEAMSHVIKGMTAAAYTPGSYTELIFSSLPVKVAVKTGTAETGEELQGHSSNAILICVAPAEKPEIAVAVVIQRGVWGAYCAPVAAAVIKEYMYHTLPKTGSLRTREDISVLIP